MAVGAHHQKVGALVGELREDRVGDVDVGRVDPLDLDLDPMAGEVQADVSARLLAVAERPVCTG